MVDFGKGLRDETRMQEEYSRDSNNKETLTELNNTYNEVKELGLLDDELNSLYQKTLEYYNQRVSEERWVFIAEEPIAAFYKAIKEKTNNLDSNKTL